MSDTSVILVAVVILVLLFMFSTRKEGFSSQEENEIAYSIDSLGDNRVFRQNTCSELNNLNGQEDAKKMFYAANGELVNSELKS